MKTNRNKDQTVHELETLADDQHCHHDRTTKQNRNLRTATDEKRHNRALLRAPSRSVWHILALGWALKWRKGKSRCTTRNAHARSEEGFPTISTTLLGLCLLSIFASHLHECVCECVQREMVRMHSLKLYAL